MLLQLVLLASPSVVRAQSCSEMHSAPDACRPDCQCLDCGPGCHFWKCGPHGEYFCSAQCGEEALCPAYKPKKTTTKKPKTARRRRTATTTKKPKTSRRRSPKPPTPTPTPPPPPTPSPTPSNSCYGPEKLSYHLDWSAEGDRFFDGFEFVENNPTGGVAQYVDHGTARNLGLVRKNRDGSTRLKTGDRQWDGRRHSVRLETKKTWKYFLAAFKFKHVPYGSGVWPAFWMNGVGKWPESGEVDILEYANYEDAKISMHTGKTNHCKLHTDAVNKCARLPDLNNMSYNCVTDYWEKPEHPDLGCGPTHKNARKNGLKWTQNPGVMVTEWTSEFVKVFYIPEKKIPKDLSSNRPKPDTWDKWVVSYYPFAESERLAPGSCPNAANVLDRQKLIINTELCGDWAGYTWEPDSRAPNWDDWSTKEKKKRCSKNHYRASDDCCGLFMGSQDSDAYLKKRAYWDIDYLKIFISQGPRGEGATEEVLV